MQTLSRLALIKKEQNAALDEAVSKINRINAFLMQGIEEKFSYDEIVQLMERIVG